MKDSLRFWRLNERLTIRDVACLVFNIDPSNINSSQPDGWAGLYRALTSAVEDDIAVEFENNREIKSLNRRRSPFDSDDDNAGLGADINKCIKENDNLIFKEMNVSGYSLRHIEDFGFDDIDEAEIKVSAIKVWLKSKDIRSAFFFPEEADKNEQQASQQLMGVQSSREQVLAEMISQRGEAELISIGRQAVWNELSRKNKDLFPPRDNVGIGTPKEFYRKQKLIRFKPGRRVNMPHPK